MDSKTSLAILARVKAEKEKRAAEGYEDAQQKLQQLIREHPVNTLIGTPLVNGIGGAMLGAPVGAVAGAGYGTAKKQPIAGTLRGAARGALTGGGILAGISAGSTAAAGLGASPGAVLGATLLGGGLGGYAGWRGADKLLGRDLEEKHAADPSLDAFSGAVQNMASTQLQSDALGDVKRFGLTGLGIGVAGRAILGAVQHLRANRAKKTRTGPAYLPMPFPATPEKSGSFAFGDDASSKSGIPWYGAASALSTIGGLALGWKGMDKLIDRQRRKRMEQELTDARSQFHDALISQYDKPVELHPELINKKASDDTMVKVGQALDQLYGKFLQAMSSQTDAVLTKQALDLPNLAGQVADGYGVYSGLTGLLAGAYVYDKVSKRSRKAVLESALKKRQRRQFMQRPTEIFAQPEPVAVPTETD